MRVLIFGPNGSGKGTQSAILVKTYSLAHVESGGIFRENIKGGTELGKEAKAYIDRGELVPDSITIPMILDRLSRPDCESGWILDGFPRNPAQAKALTESLEAKDMPLDAVLVIELARDIAKQRLMGRRSCPAGHPNNTAIEAIRPNGEGDDLFCWKCGAKLSVRKDDVDEAAIDQRLDIYFDEADGTLGSVHEMARWAEANPNAKFIRVDGESAIDVVRDAIAAKLNA